MGPRPHLSFCACKTAWLASELHVSIPSLHLWILCMQNSVFWTRKTGSMRSQTPQLLCACKTACAPELLVSIGPSPYLDFCMQNSDILDQNDKSLWVPAMSPVILCKQNSVISTRITSLYWFPALICGFWMLKQRLLDQNNKSLCVPDITRRFVHAIQRE